MQKNRYEQRTYHACKHNRKDISTLSHLVREIYSPLVYEINIYFKRKREEKYWQNKTKIPSNLFNATCFIWKGKSTIFFMNIVKKICLFYKTPIITFYDTYKLFLLFLWPFKLRRIICRIKKHTFQPFASRRVFIFLFFILWHQRQVQVKDSWTEELLDWLHLIAQILSFENYLWQMRPYKLYMLREMQLPK